MPGVLRRSCACFPLIFLFWLDGIAVSLPSAQYDRCRDKQHCQYAERDRNDRRVAQEQCGCQEGDRRDDRITRAVGLADWLRYCWR